MSDTSVSTIVQIYHIYKVATVAAMNALTGMKAMELCAVDATGNVYRYSGIAWELIISTLVGIVWKDAQPMVLSLTNQAADVTYTDLDITSNSSTAAKIAILQVYMHCVSYTSGILAVYLRKNATAPPLPVRVLFPTPIAGADYYQTVIVGLDANQILEYGLIVTSGQMDVALYLLGYIE